MRRFRNAITNYLPLWERASVLPIRGGGGGHLLLGAQCDNSSYMCLLGSHVEWLLKEPVAPVPTYATQRLSQSNCVYQVVKTQGPGSYINIHDFSRSAQELNPGTERLKPVINFAEDFKIFDSILTFFGFSHFEMKTSRSSNDKSWFTQRI